MGLPPVFVAVVLFWTGGAMPGHVKQWCASGAMQPSVGLWLFVDSIAQADVPDDCIEQSIRIIELGRDGVSRLIAARMALAPGAPPKDTLFQMLRAVLQRVRCESLSHDPLTASRA